MVSRIVAKVVLLAAFVSVAAAQTAPPRKTFSYSGAHVNYVVGDVAILEPQELE